METFQGTPDVSQIDIDLFVTVLITTLDEATCNCSELSSLL